MKKEKVFAKLRENSMLGMKSRFDLKTKLFGLFVLLSVGFMSAISCNGDAGKAALTTLAISPIAVLGKKEEDLTADEKSALSTMEKVTNEVLKEFKKGFITEEELTEKLKGITLELKEMSPEGKFGKAIAEVHELRKNLKNISDELEGYKTKGFHAGGDNTLEKQIDEMLESEKFNKYISGNAGKSSGKFHLDLKSIVSFANSYTGDKLTTEQQSRVVSKIAETKVNLRDLMMSDTIGQEYTSLTFTQITDLDRNAAFLSENGRLPQSSFKMKEVSYEVKRVGTYVPISNRILQSRQFIKSYLMNRLPKWVRIAEDFQIMFGDGIGNNLLGIAKHSDVKCVSKLITETIYTGVAGSVKEVSPYDGNKSTKIEFVNPISEISTGQKITFVGALAGSYDVHKMSDRIIVIEKAYASVTTGDVSALTFTVKNNFFNQVVDANLGDAFGAISAVSSYAEYSMTAIVMNPSTVFEVSTLKDTTGRSLNLVTNVNGANYINGKLVVETTAIKPGYYFAGDFMNGASIVDRIGITIEMMEDLESRLTNMTNLIIDEEIILPVYNPFAFFYGKLSDVLTAITKA